MFDSDGRSRPETSAPIAAPDDHAGSPSGLRHFLSANRRPLLMLLGMGVIVLFAFAVLPQLAGFGKTLHRLRYGSKAWLAAGIGLEAISLFGYMAIFRRVFSCGGARIGWRLSYGITMAGAVATKLLAAGGAGGVALTVWALRAAGVEPRALARRMAAFEVILYAVFMAALVVFGGGLASGAFSGKAPTTLTVLPAAFGAFVIVLVLAMRVAADAAERRLMALGQRVHRGRKLLQRLATVPRTLHEGVTAAVEIVGRPRLDLLGAVAYWGFDIAALWASFHAFGAAPPVAVVVMGYFIGQLANVLPLPGGVGGVEGGMIGSFIAFGLNGSVAVLAVLAYRVISFWLPILPGSVAYFQLRRTVARWRESEPEADVPELGDAGADGGSAPTPGSTRDLPAAASPR